MGRPAGTSGHSQFPEAGRDDDRVGYAGIDGRSGHRVPARAAGHVDPLAARHQPGRQHESAGHGAARGRRSTIRRAWPAGGDLRGAAFDDGRAASPGPHALAAQLVAGYDAQHPHHQPVARRRQIHHRLQSRQPDWPSTAGASCWSTPTSAGRNCIASSTSPTSRDSPTC